MTCLLFSFKNWKQEQQRAICLSLTLIYYTMTYFSSSFASMIMKAKLLEFAANNLEKEVKVGTALVIPNSPK